MTTAIASSVAVSAIATRAFYPERPSAAGGWRLLAIHIRLWDNDRMSNTLRMSWVVYRVTVKGQPSGACAVREQWAWEEMERVQPGHHTLVRAGITNEGEAERLARGGLADSGTSDVDYLKALRR
jgi:hypothetical protein